MKAEQLKQVMEACKQQLLDALMRFTREHGTDYNDYYRDEHGIEEQDGNTIVKVLDIASFGCHMALPLSWNIGIDEDDSPFEIRDKYCYYAYWSLYIERDEAGYETLMLYKFVNNGVCWDGEDAEPDHSPATDMSLSELDYLSQSIYWEFKRK